MTLTPTQKLALDDLEKAVWKMLMDASVKPENFSANAIANWLRCIQLIYRLRPDEPNGE